MARMTRTALLSLLLSCILFVAIATTNLLTMDARGLCQLEESQGTGTVDFTSISRENPLPIPTAWVDLVQNDSSGEYSFKENQNISEVLKLHNRAVLFAVPGAFTPTCSAKHLPSFVALVQELRGKGVDGIYCLSVNDRFVMKAWAESTPNCGNSGIVMVADGNAEFTKAMGLTNDRSTARMGIRSKRYAMIVENHQIVKVLVDEVGYHSSSAQHVLSLL